MNDSGFQTEQDRFSLANKPKRKPWPWLLGCGGSMVLLCVLLGVFVYSLFPIMPESFPLKGEVSLPATVGNGDDFDVVLTLTNPTADPIFINQIVLHRSTGPSILDGATVTGVEPEMDFEFLLTSRNDQQYSYFREIKPGETQRVIFHMQAQEPGIYYENVGVYAKDPLLPGPAFLHAFHYVDASIEITP